MSGDTHSRMAALRSELHAQRESLPHCVYRAYDDAGGLLYVGCSYDFDTRRRQHERKSPWAARASRWTIEWHGTRTQALAHERRAIGAERPECNVPYEETSRRSWATMRRQAEVERAARRADLARIMASLRPSREHVA